MKHRLSFCWFNELRIKRFSRDRFIIILYLCYVNDERMKIIIFIPFVAMKMRIKSRKFFFFQLFFFLRIILFQKRWKKYKFKIFWIIMTRDWKISFELKLMVKRFVWKFYMSRIFFLYLINNIDRIYYDHMHSILRDNCFKNIKGCFY